MSTKNLVTIGEELEPFRVLARQAAMDHYVAIALSDQRPATQRAMDTRKAGEARAVAAGGSSNLISLEAIARGCTPEQLARLILTEADKADQIELDRVRTSLAIDAAQDHVAVLEILRSKGISILPSAST